MKKEKLIEILTQLIEKLYEEENLTDELIEEIENNLNELTKYVEQNKYYREIILLCNTSKIALQERRNSLKIAIIMNLEKELKKLREI